MITRGEMARRRSLASPLPTSLPDSSDLLREILLRLPPCPSSLPRVSLVCKRWRSLVADPLFQRRFRDHHGKPPLLGFFVDDYGRSCPFVPVLDGPDRIPAARFSMPLDEGYNIIDCRHGLVLLLGSSHKYGTPIRLLVWDPVAREQHRLILPPELDNGRAFIFNGTVLRPAGGHRHFHVALAARYLGSDDTSVLACLYSSEVGTWSNIIKSPQLQWFIVTPEPSTLIGNSICWLLKLLNDDNHQYAVLEFDLHRQSLVVIELPSHVLTNYKKLRLMPTEDGGLGFIDLVFSGFHAELWKRKPDSDGLAVWVLDRTIVFKELRSTYRISSVCLVGFAEESNAILLRINTSFFMVNLQSMEYKKLANLSFFNRYYPFEYCYAAGTGIVDGHGEEEVSNM